MNLRTRLTIPPLDAGRTWDGSYPSPSHRVTGTHRWLVPVPFRCYRGPPPGTGRKGGRMWPEGFRCAASFTFDFDAEEVWIGEDPANADKPGVLSQGTYGAKVAVPLILELLATHGLTATFFIPARVAERHPHRVKQIAAAGHEIAHHGYTHTSPTKLSPQEEEEELRKGLEILRSFGGEVVGYRSPSWDF